MVSYHPRHCTHLVTNSISRTVKFLCALSVTKYIVSSYWIEQSALENKFLGKFEHAVQVVFLSIGQGHCLFFFCGGVRNFDFFNAVHKQQILNDKENR